MLQKIVQLVGGDPHKKEVQRLSEIVDQINTLEPEYEKLDDYALKEKTSEFRQRLADGETLDDLLPEAFAAVREASKRTIGLRHYDVQLIGGMTLHNTKIAEMRTGEGKTLVATLPLYLNALTGRGVHLVTVNDYLARRDARWMAPIYQSLGLSVGVLQMASRTENGKKAFIVDLEKESPHEDQHQFRMTPRAEAYQTDIVYGTNSEFGFDYLRDNLTSRLEDRVQRGHYYAIVDEVDNILIDEARTPLIISGPAQDEAEQYIKMAAVVRQLRPEDYEVDEKNRSVVLTEVGEVHVEEILDTPLRDPDRPEDITPEQARILAFLEQGLRAQFLFRRNKDYLVQGGKVVIVDEFTGRLMPGRRWSEGLHQAVEAKEGVKVEPENITYATITLQNYFRMYEKLAGMTGTALTEEEEFYKIYKLNVLPIPTNLEFQAMKAESTLLAVDSKDEDGYRVRYYTRREDTEKAPLFWQRKDYPDIVYRTEEAKLRAIVTEILHYYVIGRPQLVGTTSVEHSERLSDRLVAEPLRRLAMVHLIRDVWMAQHPNVSIEREIPELQFLNKSLGDLNTGEMRTFARGLGIISMNPEDPSNVEKLISILKVQPEHTERLTKVLQGGVPHQVLNARKHDEEALIIARAGAFGAVTIATNMAGRGVDIRLGGELPDEIYQDVTRVLAHEGFDAYNMTNEQMLEALKKLDAETIGIYETSVQGFYQYMIDKARVRELGGLHVVGSERHEARRIDNQLRGRAARQGDPGSSRFFLSLEDELMRLFGGTQAENMMRMLKVDPALPIESSILGRLVEQAQERVEGNNFDVRKHLLEYDDVLNSQRKRIYGERDEVFVKKELNEDVLSMLRTELMRRIPEALENEEGPWKLLAFLEEIQPSRIDPQSGEVLPSYSIRLIADDVNRKLNGSKDPALLRATLLDLAGQAIDTENEHLMTSFRLLLDRTEEAMTNQQDERLDTLDTYFEGLGEPEEGQPARRPQEILDELSGLVRTPLKLPSELFRKLPEGDDEVKEALRQQVQNGVMLTNVVRVQGAVERRLDEALDIKLTQLLNQGWDEISAQLNERVETALTRRKERLVGNYGQVVQNLDNLLGRISPDELSDNGLLTLITGMATGTKIEIDQRSKRKGWRRVVLINYIFLATHFLEQSEPKEISEGILTHLEDIQERMTAQWGVSEWERLSAAGVTLSQFLSRYSDSLTELLGEERLSELQTVPLLEIQGEDKTRLLEWNTWRVTTEIYRHILLTSISDLWVEYLTKVEGLRVTIGLEAYAQRDPLVQYKSRASEMFTQLLADIRMAVISRMFLLAPRRPAQPTQPAQPQQQNAPIGNQPPSQGRSDGDTQSDLQAKKKRKRH